MAAGGQMSNAKQEKHTRENNINNNNNNNDNNNNDINNSQDKGINKSKRKTIIKK